MVSNPFQTNRKFKLIIRSRASASPFLIFTCESSISCCGVKREKKPDLSQVSIESSIEFIHVQNVFGGLNPPLLRGWGDFSVPLGRQLLNPLPR